MGAHKEPMQVRDSASMRRFLYSRFSWLKRLLVGRWPTRAIHQGCKPSCMTPRSYPALWRVMRCRLHLVHPSHLFRPSDLVGRAALRRPSHLVGRVVLARPLALLRRAGQVAPDRLSSLEDREDPDRPWGLAGLDHKHWGIRPMWKPQRQVTCAWP